MLGGGGEDRILASTYMLAPEHQVRSNCFPGCISVHRVV